MESLSANLAPMVALTQTGRSSSMSTDHTIKVKFFNEWGCTIENVKLQFSASKSSVEVNSYSNSSLANAASWGPLTRHYQTGAFSEEFDYWYVSFTATGSNGAPAGKYWAKNNFSCVIDSSIPSSGT